MRIGNPEPSMGAIDNRSLLNIASKFGPTSQIDYMQQCIKFTAVLYIWNACELPFRPNPSLKSIYITVMEGILLVYIMDI